MGIIGVSNSEKLDTIKSVNFTNTNNTTASIKGMKEENSYIESELIDLVELCSEPIDIDDILQAIKNKIENIRAFAGDINKVLSAVRYMIDNNNFKVDLRDIKYDKEKNTITIGHADSDTYIVIPLDDAFIGNKGELLVEEHWHVGENYYVDYITKDGKVWRCAEYRDIYSDGSRLIRNTETGDLFIANEKLEDITSHIFGDFNIPTIQYGGSQMDFRHNNLELIQDPRIQSIIKEYWPDATEEDMSMLLYKLCNVGCGYTSCINSLFMEYQGRELEFEEKFGFPMYIKNGDGTIDYNYEYLILEFFLYVNAYDFQGNLRTISDLYGDVDENVDDGAVGVTTGGLASGTNHEDISNFSIFLKEKYNVDVNIECIGDGAPAYPLEVGSEAYDRAIKGLQDSGIDIEYGTELYGMPETNEELAAKIQEYLDEGKTILINGSSYGLDGQRIGAHAVTVVDINDNGEIIVSSWGEQYVLDIEEFEAQYGITVIDYN